MAEFSAETSADQSGREAQLAEQDPVRQAHLRNQQVRLLAQQWTRSPYVVAIVSAFVAYVVYGHVQIAVVGVWIGTLMALLFARIPYSKYLLRNPPADAQRTLNQMVLFPFIHGIYIGAAIPLFFRALPHDEQILLTLILVCWTVGGVAVAAAYARAFYFYIAPALPTIALFWLSKGDAQSVGVGVLILLFGLIQVTFARDSERVVRESFLIRYENERLLEALERERQEVLLARDRAEEANRAKSQFLAAASHDLRQPLHALSLYSATLTMRAVDGTTGEIAGYINKALASLSTLVDSLLDISKLDAGAVRPELRRVNVKELIERIEADYRPVARDRRLIFSAPHVEAVVETDPVLLERVLRNLVDNAFKYTVVGSVTLDAKADENLVKISVRDTGPGIPKTERERIFQEFYQVGNPERDRAKGLGLGLAIVQRLAKLLGVEVQVESHHGRGSTFSVTLARLTGDSAPAFPPHSAANDDVAALAGVKVLVIDDEPSVRIGMRALLESWGCRVTACGGFTEAQRIIEDYALEVDLIVADFRLPQNENGIETVRRLRERLGEVPALMVSGDTAPERLREAQASGLPFLHKPVSADKLKETMLAVLRR